MKFILAGSAVLEALWLLLAASVFCAGVAGLADVLQQSQDTARSLAETRLRAFTIATALRTAPAQRLPAVARQVAWDQGGPAK